MPSAITMWSYVYDYLKLLLSIWICILTWRKKNWIEWICSVILVLFQYGWKNKSLKTRLISPNMFKELLDSILDRIKISFKNKLNWKPFSELLTVHTTGSEGEGHGEDISRVVYGKIEDSEHSEIAEASNNCINNCNIWNFNSIQDSWEFKSKMIGHHNLFWKDQRLSQHKE